MIFKIYFYNILEHFDSQDIILLLATIARVFCFSSQNLRHFSEIEDCIWVL